MFRHGKIILIATQLSFAWLPVVSRSVMSYTCAFPALTKKSRAERSTVPQELFCFMYSCCKHCGHFSKLPVHFAVSNPLHLLHVTVTHHAQLLSFFSSSIFRHSVFLLVQAATESAGIVSWVGTRTGGSCSDCPGAHRTASIWGF